MSCAAGIGEACRAASVMLRHAGDQSEADRYLKEACEKGSKRSCKVSRKRWPTEGCAAAATMKMLLGRFPSRGWSARFSASKLIACHFACAS